MEFLKVVEGLAKFKDKNSITVDDKEFKGIKIIVATGSTTTIPPIEGLTNVPYLTNDTLFDLEEQPKSIVIIGGGYIGLEIAQAYSRLG
ncbi:MAG: FAD-dependent oxidoreductase, partial [Anditalea sp.]